MNSPPGPGHQLIYSIGWELGERERQAVTAVSGHPWQIAVDDHGEVWERRSDDACGDQGCARRKCWIEEAHVAELNGLLRQAPPTCWRAALRPYACSPAASGLVAWNRITALAQAP